MMTKRKAEQTVEFALITGADILNDANKYQGGVLYMAPYQHDALTLAAAASHTIDSFTSIFRVFAVSDKGQAGKSTLLRTLMALGNNPWKSKPTTFALRSKFNDRERPLVVVDEIGGVYGKDGMRAANPEIDTVIKEGYECNATFSVSRQGVAEDLPCYCVAAFGGLRKAVPDDVFSRCIVWKMDAAPPGIAEGLRDSLEPSVRIDGEIHGKRIHQWARANAAEIQWAFRNFKRPHPKMVSRLRQIWGPLYAVALVAGGDWPERCVAAFRAMALDSSEEPVLTSEQRVLRDAAELSVKLGKDRLFSRDLAKYLLSLPDEEGLYEALSNRDLALLMTKALGKAASIPHPEGGRAKGWYTRAILTAWKRLEASLQLGDDEDDEPDEFDDFFEVTDDTHADSENPRLAA